MPAYHVAPATTCPRSWYLYGVRVTLVASAVVTLAVATRALAAGPDADLSLERECARACQPMRDLRDGPDAGENILSMLARTANPFLTSAECPEICRGIGREHPSVDMKRAFLGHVIRCAMQPAFDVKKAPPVASCVAGTPLDESAVSRYARQGPSPEEVPVSGSAVAVSLEERASIGEIWSRAFAFWLVPLFPVLCAAFGLSAALRHERMRRRVSRPPPGWAAVEGRICDDGAGDKPVIAVSFELKSTTYRGQTSYKEKSHHVEVRPFTLATRDGRLIDVRPERRTIELHAPARGEGCQRRAAVVPGDTVWVCGRQAQGGPPSQAAGAAALYRSPRSGTHIDGAEARIMVSVTPIAEVFRRDRNRRLWWVASLVGLLAIVELGFFGSFLDLLSSGRIATGHVVDKSSWWRRSSTSRGGSSRPYRVHAVTIEAEGRTEKLEVREMGWEDAAKGSPVPVLLTSGTLALGTVPYTTFGRCCVAVILVFFGLLIYLLLGRIDSGWYSVERGWRPTDELAAGIRSTR